MFIETILIPFLLGIVTNKTSDTIFKSPDLAQIINELYYKACDIFNKKYPDEFGGKYNNFLTRALNIEVISNAVMNLDDILKLAAFDITDFHGNETPDVIVSEFIVIFNNLLNEDPRLVSYRFMRKSALLSEDIIEKMNMLLYARFKKFVDPSAYFNFDGHESFTETYKLKQDISNIIDSFEKNQIIIVDSFRGFGKSTLLEALSYQVEIMEIFDYVVFMRHGIRSIFDALQAEIINDKRYLIIVDDIELCFDEFKELLNFVKFSEVTIEIVAATQSYLHDEEKLLLNNIGLLDKALFYSLNKWQPEDFLELLHLTSGAPSIEDEEIIVAKYPNPSLIKRIGKLKINDTGENIQVLFTKYRESLLSDTFRILEGILTQIECRNLLFSLCCSIPFSDTNADFSALKTSLGKEIDIALILKLLINGGVLRKVGKTFRFLPDLKGDLYMAYCLENHQDIYVNILNYWLSNSQERLLENIHESAHVSDIDMTGLLIPLVEQWSLTEDCYAQSRILKNAVYIVQFMPSTILNMLYCFLDSNPPTPTLWYGRLTTDDFGPVVIKLWRYSDEIEPILYFVLQLYTAGYEGHYDNYKVKGLVTSLFTPVNNRLDKVLSALEILDKWISTDQVGAIELFRNAACEILKGSHEVTKGVINGIQFGHQMLNVSPILLKIRTRCIEILSSLINSDLTYANAVIINDVAKNIGRGSGWGYDTNEFPLASVFIDERKIITNLVGTYLLESDQIANKIIFEGLLLNWWASEVKGSEKAAHYLLDFTRDAEYLFAKSYIDFNNLVVSFDEIVKVAPSENRWSWFVHEVLHREDDKQPLMAYISKLLNEKITDINELCILLHRIALNISKFNYSNKNSNVLSAFFSLNPDLFNNYLHSDLFQPTSDYFKASIIESIITNSKGSMRSQIEYIMSLELTSIEVNRILWCCTQEELSDEYVYSIFSKIIDGTFLIEEFDIVRSTYFVFRSRKKDALVPLLLKILNRFKDVPLHLGFWDTLLESFNIDITTNDNYPEFKLALLDRLYNSSDSEYYENEILNLLLPSFGERLAFVEEKIIRSKQNENLSYFNSDISKYLSNHIKTTQDLKLFVELFMRLLSSKYIDEYFFTQQIKPLFIIPDSVESCLGVALIKAFIKDESIDSLLTYIDCFTLTENTADDFVYVLKYLESKGNTEKAIQLIYSKRFPSNGWSRSIGQSSPEMELRLTLYRKMNQIIGFGRLRQAIEKCISYLESEIVNDLVSDEERFNPR